MPEGVPADPLSPRFLLEHAERLTSSTGGGRPPTIDARRAASAAYYAAYHATTGAVSRSLFGSEWLHGVRLLSHRAVLDASRLLSRLGPVDAADPGSDPEKGRDRAIWQIFQEIGGARPDLLDTMETLRALKNAREIADYDRTQTISRIVASELVRKSEDVTAFFDSDRRDSPDTRVFVALAALKA